MGVRKTVTFHDDIYKAIQRERATLMIEENEDFNFTEAVNYMLDELLDRRAENPMFEQLPKNKQ